MTPTARPLDESRAWAILLALADRAGAGAPPLGGSFAVDASGAVVETGSDGADLTVTSEGFRTSLQVTPPVEQMLDLYLPLCVGAGSPNLVLGHLGQSMDGQIATASGASRWVTGQENITHIHRLRAISHAVVVGAKTVESDDPLLTTRLVAGGNPTRVVIDPHRRLPENRHVFQDDAAPTLVICRRGMGQGGRKLGRAEIVEVSGEEQMLSPRTIVEALRARGLTRLFVEGGGITISQFLEARALGRLHLTISPLFIGRGTPGISVPPVDALEHALRPPTRRFHLGPDVLFDCALDEVD